MVELIKVAGFITTFNHLNITPLCPFWVFRVIAKTLSLKYMYICN